MELLRTADAAAYLNLKKVTLETWRCQGRGPIYLKINGAVRYALKDLDTFLETCRRSNTGRRGK